jgi:hypothetical protein
MKYGIKRGPRKGALFYGVIANRFYVKQSRAFAAKAVNAILPQRTPSTLRRAINRRIRFVIAKHYLGEAISGFYRKTVKSCLTQSLRNAEKNKQVRGKTQAYAANALKSIHHREHREHREGQRTG